MLAIDMYEIVIVIFISKEPLDSSNPCIYLSNPCVCCLSAIYQFVKPSLHTLMPLYAYIETECLCLIFSDSVLYL